jgi:glucosamine-6-phosphate deaminase
MFCKQVSDEKVEEVFVDLAVDHNKRVLDITEDDVKRDRLAMEVVARREEPLTELLTQVYKSLTAKIERGTRTLSDTVFLHTEPHPDDLMLGYLPYIVRHIRDSSNHHHFASMTSGFTAVTDFFLRKQLEILRRWIDTAEFCSMFEEGYFDPDNITGCHRDVWEYLDGVAANLDIKRSQGAARRLLRNLIDVYDIDGFGEAMEKIDELEGYLDRHRPGEEDTRDVQKLKGMCREWEAECLWGYLGWDSNDISNHRLAFYTGAVFTEEPTEERDVLPVFELLKRVAPDVVSVALDPEASGPDTHYKVLQVVAESLRHYSDADGRHDVRVWGYRNVWYKFHPSEANIYVPVSLNMFSIMRDAFMNAFISQKDAPFPSFELDGPFCELARKIQVEQYQEIKTCLGREWFHKHKSPLVRATRGLVFLRDMNLEEFYGWSRKLRKAAENR